MTKAEKEKSIVQANFVNLARQVAIFRNLDINKFQLPHMLKKSLIVNNIHSCGNAVSCTVRDHIIVVSPAETNKSLFKVEEYQGGKYVFNDITRLVEYHLWLAIMTYSLGIIFT